MLENQLYSVPQLQRHLPVGTTEEPIIAVLVLIPQANSMPKS